MYVWWRDLSVAKKLYSVVGVMALLIATELITLLFVMDILSAVRTFVGGESLWSKAQKGAVHALHRYAFTHDPKYFNEFHRLLETTKGSRMARLEMLKEDPDEEVMRQSLRQGQAHPDDIPGMIRLIRRFYWVSPVEQSLVLWEKADQKIDELIVAAFELDKVIRLRPNAIKEIGSRLEVIDHLNESLTKMENEFSEILSEGSRWLERILMMILVFVVLVVECTGVLLTIAFSRNFSRSLNDLTQAAGEIGKGNFGVWAPVRSRDELGMLAESINKMSHDLKNSLSMRERAESASEFKSRFLANMSHEIRTPLGVMMGLTEILKDPHLSWQDHMQYVDTIERTGQSLTRIINDILDLSKVEAGHLEIKKTAFSLSVFLSELKHMFLIQADKTGNQLSFECSANLPEEVVTDRTRLRQILVNLLNNSLKYTHNGHVSLKCNMQDSHIIFEVSDTGRGIADEDRDKVFEAFTRARTSTSSGAEGTGLGLMLSRHFANALGGNIELVSSGSQIGSVFRVSLPFESSTASTASPGEVKSFESAKDLRGHSILVVEDSEDNQLLVKLFLNRMGLKVELARNGREGVDKALAFDYDMVLMDMQMPVLDGYQATAELRNKGFTKPIVALTAHAMKEDRDRCLRAGCSDYLTKPIDSKALSQVIAKNLLI